MASAIVGVGEQLVDGGEQRPLERRPPVAVGPAATAAISSSVMPGVAAEHHVLGPLVLAVPHGGDAQHEQLALARRQRRGEEHVAVEGVERAGELRVVGERAEDVQALRPVGVAASGTGGAGPAGRSAASASLHLLRPLAGRERRDPRRRSPVFRPPLTPMTWPVM